ncbi:MAG: hypothetical protein IT258_21670, partial [Saprospiraceae bacterium]|nr:hypothetical protein [Saprospiraceae bacterium]
MKSLLTKFKEAPLFTAGIGLLIVESIPFLLEYSIDTWGSSNIFSSHFLLAYLIFIIMFIAVAADNKNMTGKMFKFYDLQNNLMLLLLGNASAYALNREIQVFQPSADWLCWFLVILNAAVAIAALRWNEKPDWLNHVCVAVI